MAKLPMPFNNPDFGEYVDGKTQADHSGVDFPQPYGAIIRASSPGVITYRGWLNNAAGYSTIVRYDNGPSVLYCHQPGTERIPAVGTRVTAGTVIGVVGSSGNSTGPHLHLGITEGAGAGTHAGVWRFFDKTTWVGGTAGKPAETPTLATLTGADMDKAVIIFFKGNWALVGATVPGGVRTTKQQETANAWATIYGNAKTMKTQADYNRVIAEAKAVAAAWLTQQKQIHG